MPKTERERKKRNRKRKKRTDVRADVRAVVADERGLAQASRDKARLGGDLIDY